LIIGLINFVSGDLLGDMFQFNTNLFDFIIIPAIIFESGYSLKKKGLFSNLLSIVLYAVVGTLISALFIGFMMFVFAKFAGVESIATNSPIEALVFGSIISAIDPVASLAILGDVFRVKETPDVPRIYTVIFGESVINDAVSIVLFRIFLKYVDTQFTAGNFFEMVGMFIYVSLGSVVVGIVIAFLSALFFKHVSFREHNAAEVIILTIWAYSSYLLAEAASLSGIMSLFVCGIFMGRYTWHNLSEYSQLTTPQTFKALANLGDTYVFLYLGLAAFGFSDIHQWKFGFIGLSLVSGIDFAINCLIRCYVLLQEL
jgi:NhaP-type Na+/H+ or K+/H+ antiporter